MLPKTPKPAIWKFIKGSAKTLFVLEAVCFAASYGLYYRMNTDQDFRRYINEKYPFALDYYYKIGELVGDSKARQTDSISWSSQAVEFAKKVMASNPYVKSVLWLIGFGGAGYGLMLLTEPSAEKIERIKASAAPNHPHVDQQRKALFMKKLQEAATTSTPIYRTPANSDKKET